MARNEQLIRQHKILQILERVRFGKTIEELRDDVVQELGLNSIHVRTLRRDLEALQAAGVDVAAHDSPRGKVWKLGPLARTATKITATSTELIALALGRQLMFPLAGTPFWRGIESFWNKIHQEIPPSVLEHYEKYWRTLRVIGVPVKSYESHQGMLGTIHRAITEHRVLEIEYESPGKPVVTREINPYAVVLFQASLYVLGVHHDDPKAGIRTWKLDRFHRAVALDRYFRVDESLNIDEHFGDSMGIFVGSKPQNFRIRLTPQAARWVSEEPWHPEQVLKQLRGGEFELSVRAAHQLEILPRVLQLGTAAEIVAPPSARRTMASIVRELAARYGQPED
jgi:predicted DNA-binding transcriptional regulator YafY